MEDMIKGLLGQPAVWAIITKFAVDAIKGQLQKIDNEHMVQNYKAYVQVAIAVFSGIAAFLALALQGHAAQFDPKPLVEWAVTLYLASQGVNASLTNAHSAVKKMLKKDAN